MKILVIGGAGYIGSHAVKELVNSHDIVVYDNLDTGHKEFVDKKAVFVQGDLSDNEKLNNVFNEYNIDAVMHFANYASVAESVKYPDRYFNNNVVNGLNLLNAMIKNDVKKIIFSSSCAIYGIPNEIPISESSKLNPINPYGETKLMFERILRYFDTAYGLKSISLRYFNVAGASPDLIIGEKHENETHLIPLIFDTILGKKDHVKIYGDDYDTYDGTCIRDYIHVLDIAKAHSMALEYLNNNMQTKSYNIGIGQGYSVKEVIELCKNITGREIKTIIDKRREGDPPVLVANPERFKKDAGWKEEFNIKDMIKHAWEWHKKIN
ncbi:UDP-glucose 4-epimerase GalE [Candidatus Woesearchaeota archaeon]|nr:UDP-glucose 4-epimerase GalE [Candidatus Woesearchaeota archaeon]